MLLSQNTGSIFSDDIFYVKLELTFTSKSVPSIILKDCEMIKIIFFYTALLLCLFHKSYRQFSLEELFWLNRTPNQNF